MAKEGRLTEMAWRKAVLKPAMVEFREPEPKRTLTKAELQKSSFMGISDATTYLVMEQLVRGEDVSTPEGDVFAMCGRDYVVRSWTDGSLSVMSQVDFYKKYGEIKSS